MSPGLDLNGAAAAGVFTNFLATSRLSLVPPADERERQAVAQREHRDLTREPRGDPHRAIRAGQKPARRRAYGPPPYVKSLQVPACRSPCSLRVRIYRLFSMAGQQLRDCALTAPESPTRGRGFRFPVSCRPRRLPRGRPGSRPSRRLPKGRASPRWDTRSCCVRVGAC